MPFFRVQYQGYLEDEYDEADSAVEDFIDVATQQLEDSHNLSVEVFNEETQEWEPV